MTDPKHLPPRDCLVLVDSTWYHARFYDEEPESFWEVSDYYGINERLEPADVITWRELPEVE